MTDSVHLAAQADWLLSLARLFRRPDQETLALVRDMSDAAGDLGTWAGLAPEVMEMVTALGEAADAASLEVLCQEHDRLFEGTLACPPNESIYVRRDKGPLLGDISAFYTAFGFHLAPDLGEKADHLSCELDFLGALTVMLARALEEGKMEAAEITRNAMVSFADDHLGTWMTLFAARLASETHLPYYGRLAELLMGVWQGLASQHGFALPDDPPPPGELELDSGEMECDMATRGMH